MTKFRSATIYYRRVDDFWRKEDKYLYLEQVEHRNNITWLPLTPDKKYAWITEGLRDEFDDFISIGSKEAKSSNEINPEAIFKKYGRGIATARDAWAYNFNRANLTQNIRKTIDVYNECVFRWSHQKNQKSKLDDFVKYEDTQISWSRDLKLDLERRRYANFLDEKVRKSLYRPFTKSYLFFDRILNEEVYVFPAFFPTPATEKENRVICVVNEAQIPFSTQMAACIPCLHYGGRQTQCFPFYTYDEDGTNRRENITDWALNQFCSHYQDDAIAKWDIFHYVYAVLHHQQYRDRYAANLKRELPRIPFVSDFWAFANAGKRLAEIHVNYEQQPEYPLRWIENRNLPLDWRVQKMKLSKDKTQLVYNDFLTLNSIPPKTFDYRIGNRSALDWVINQYQVKTDKRSGITNDPNRLDDEQYIVRLIGQVITVSLETVKIVNSLPSLGIPDS